MKITCYRSHELKATSTFETSIIESVSPPDEMTDEERDGLINGGWEPMANFQVWNEKDDRWEWKAVPWAFVIKIEE